jgi:hypothetical protein
MNVNTHRNSYTNKAANFAPLLWVFTFILLFLSCPVKRMLLTVSGEQTASQTKVKAASQGISKTSYQYSKEKCCSLKSKDLYEQPHSSHQVKQKLSSEPLFNAEQSGFSIHYAVNDFDSVNSFSDQQHFTAWSIPLFLQHRRLLI